ncbi:hypothetical protein [Thermaerobacillus caldiproteolyticus]|uniref:Uncharacterized protein n=1 Tax=Thermaerobacillus caldiproteolyticus TaxID=247480 RepID=A0A7W0BYL1_9BACL|nr:hypothetical protein [Anoxybacillus caldiproteolyticus]MBA2875826.1 hypothetical protein [Anoxybacillus caldiproteolyticus]
MSKKVYYFTYLLKSHLAGQVLLDEFKKHCFVLSEIEEEEQIKFDDALFFDRNFRKLFEFYKRLEHNSTVVVFHPCVLVGVFPQVLPLFALKNITIQFLEYEIGNNTVKNKKFKANDLLELFYEDKIDFIPQHV